MQPSTKGAEENPTQTLKIKGINFLQRQKNFWNLLVVFAKSQGVKQTINFLNNVIYLKAHSYPLSNSFREWYTE